MVRGLAPNGFDRPSLLQPVPRVVSLRTTAAPGAIIPRGQGLHRSETHAHGTTRVGRMMETFVSNRSVHP
eukprot:56833-Rhodomonas_salina.4